MTIDARPPMQLSGRFRLLHEAELASPAKCVICGGLPSTMKGENRFITGTSQAEELTTKFTDEGESYLVDGRLDFEFYGTVYFCKTCTLEMAALYGGVSAEQYEELIKKYDALFTEHNYVIERCRELEGVRDSLSSELVRISGVGIVGNNSPQPPVAETIAPTSNANLGEPISETTSSESSTGNQSSNEFDFLEGPDDISGPSSDGFLDF